MNSRSLLTTVIALALAVPLAAQTYTYDAAGRLTSVGFPDGKLLYYSYDLAGSITRVATLLDTDLDGMEDSWEVQFFGSIAAGNPNGDLDGDGLTELAEFTLGLRPDLHDSAGATIVGLGSDAGEEFLEFTYQRSKTGALFDTYTVELSHNLLTWFSGPAHVEEVGAPFDLGSDLEQVRFRVVLPATAAPALFVRLLIERKP